MRNRLTSGRISRLAAAAALLVALPSVVCAWDEDRVASQIQPYFGGWAGAYMINTNDLNQLFNRSRSSDKYTMDNFLPVVPAAGLSLGVAYSRLHVGINVGYQLMDGTDISKAAAWGVYPSYRYQVIPIDLSLDVGLMRNESPVNILLGGSIGIGMVGIKNPYRSLYYLQGTDSVVKYLENEWFYTNALLATGYVGARINLARRLNLEGQIGWRILTSDATDLGSDGGAGRKGQVTYDSTRVNIKDVRIDPLSLSLSGAYLRADIRWTFASQNEKDEDRAAARSREMTERLAMLPPPRSSN